LRKARRWRCSRLIETPILGDDSSVAATNRTDRWTHQIIAEGECTSLPVDAPDAPTFDEMQANQGALLRASLAATAEYCIDDYRKRILGLY